MPVHSVPDLRLPLPDDRAVLDRMPGSSVPVIRQPFAPDDFLPYWAYGGFTGPHLFAVDDDPHEEHDLAGTALEKELADALREALREVGASGDQYERLGLR